jgi:hypothetical protein
MATFVSGTVVKELNVDGRRWQVRVVEIYNPSAAEIEANKKFNDTLGNWDPERERPVEAWVRFEISTNGSEPFEMRWSPAQKIFGPHVTRKGWDRGTFNAIKGELLRWRLP